MGKEALQAFHKDLDELHEMLHDKDLFPCEPDKSCPCHLYGDVDKPGCEGFWRLLSRETLLYNEARSALLTKHFLFEERDELKAKIAQVELKNNEAQRTITEIEDTLNNDDDYVRPTGLAIGQAVAQLVDDYAGAQIRLAILDEMLTFAANQWAEETGRSRDDVVKEIKEQDPFRFTVIGPSNPNDNPEE